MSEKGSYELRQVHVRLKLEEGASLYSNEMISSPDSAVEIMAEAMKSLSKEHVCVVNLDGRNAPINFNIVSMGSINEAPVNIAELYKSSILSNSASVLVLHNHPSGGLDPSDADWKITEKMIEAGKLMDIPVLDHVIIGGINGHVYSLREERPYMFPVGEKVPIYGVGEDRRSLRDRVKDLTDQLEKGLSALFQSGRYEEYLKSMGAFHAYSVNNSILINMARPDATRVASYQTWKKLGRQVSKNEKGIAILVPTPYKRKIEQQKTDVQGRPVVDKDGKPVTETVEKLVQHYKIGHVFDIRQTYGKPLPEIVHQLKGSVSGYDDLLKAIRDTSSVPIDFEHIEGPANGYFHNSEKRIAIKEGMSQEQTIKTAIHECAHSILHDKDIGVDKDVNTLLQEQTAESIAYCVCSHYGIDSSDYSFGYILGWAQGKEPKELKAHLHVIRDTSHDLISRIDGQLKEIEHEREKEQLKEPKSEEKRLTFFAAECAVYHNLGDVYEAKDLHDACEKYREMLTAGTGMTPAIGIRYHDRQDPEYDGSEIDLMTGRIIDAETVNQISVYRESKEVQQAIQELRQEFPNALIRGGSEMLVKDPEIAERQVHRHR